MAIAGGRQRTDHAEQVLGADVAVDYRDPAFPERLAQAAGEGIDVFFDNVGGRQLTLALSVLKNHGHVVLCGSVSSYARPDDPDAGADLRDSSRAAQAGLPAGEPRTAGRGDLPVGRQAFAERTGMASRIQSMTAIDDSNRGALLRRGFALEYTTLCWNVIGIVVLGMAAISARSVALAGFGLDSLIEIGASTVVIWELSGVGQRRQRRALRLIGYAFAVLVIYLLAQSTLVLATGYHPRHSSLGIIWTAVTAALMFVLAVGKARTGRALDNPVLRAEGRVTLIDGILAAAVLLGLVLNAALGWWWADPAAGYVLVYYAVREVREIFIDDH